MGMVNRKVLHFQVDCIFMQDFCRCTCDIGIEDDHSWTWTSSYFDFVHRPKIIALLTLNSHYFGTQR